MNQKKLDEILLKWLKGEEGIERPDLGSADISDKHPDLTGADLRGANLKCADLADIKGLTE